MTAPDRTYDRIRFHRGSRGFAAFVTGLNASILLGLALFATPSLGLSQPDASWFVILAGAAGIGHVAAVVGLIRGRACSGALVGYLAAAGIAVAAGVPAAADPADRPPDPAGHQPADLRRTRPVPHLHAHRLTVDRPGPPVRYGPAGCGGVDLVICPIRDMTFARFRVVAGETRMAAMDTVGMVILAISALALLEVAAANLRGEERHPRPRRLPAPRR